MNYLVTGGAGFIGSHLADALLARQNRVTVLDDLSTGSLSNVAHNLDHPAFEMREGSILDAGLVHRLVDEADVVVHLAAAVGVQLILSRPLEALLTNVKGTEHVIEACAASRTKVMIASTSEIYGKNGAGALREDADRLLGSLYKARWSYSTAKAVDEILAYTYHRERGTPTIVVRFFNCVGPRQTGAYGMVVPRLVRQALDGNELTVFGDGQQQRCFCHVLDTVDCVVRLLEEPAAVGDVFNVGAQQEISIDDLAQLVLELTGSISPVRHVPYEEAYEAGFEDLPRRMPDISKVTALTGWRPQRSLRQIVEEVIAYTRSALASV